jgi:hypothetical protein
VNDVTPAQHRHDLGAVATRPARTEGTLLDHVVRPRRCDIDRCDRVYVCAS